MYPTCDLLRFLCSWELILHHSWEILRNNIFQSCFFPIYFFFLLEYMLEQFLALSKMSLWLNSSFACHALFDTFLLIFTWVHWCCSVLGVAVCCIGCFSIEVTMCCCFRMNTSSFVILILHWNILFLILCNFVSLFDINYTYLNSFFYYWCSRSSSLVFLTRALGYWSLQPPI